MIKRRAALLRVFCAVKPSHSDLVVGEHLERAHVDEVRLDHTCAFERDLDLWRPRPMGASHRRKAAVRREPKATLRGGDRVCLSAHKSELKWPLGVDAHVVGDPDFSRNGVRRIVPPGLQWRRLCPPGDANGARVRRTVALKLHRVRRRLGGVVHAKKLEEDGGRELNALVATALSHMNPWWPLRETSVDKWTNCGFWILIEHHEVIDSEKGRGQGFRFHALASLLGLVGQLDLSKPWIDFPTA